MAPDESSSSGSGDHESDGSGRLFIVAGPIGNLADLTLRARECLEQADVIACEDTRHSLRLLGHYGIRKPLVSLHEHNEASRSADLVERIRAGARVACLSDAGMPGISDPGARLIFRCIQEGLPYEVLPGPSAVITALVGSGLPCDEFYFGGFLPPKKGKREKQLTAALEREYSSVFFESPHRLLSTLEMLEKLAPERLICVARELTKKFETFHRGTATEMHAHFTSRVPKGEITLVIAGQTLPKWMRTDDERRNEMPESPDIAR